MPKEPLSPQPEHSAAPLRQRLHSSAFLVIILALLALAGYVILERGQPAGWTRPKLPVSDPLPAPARPQLREVVGAFARNQTITEALAGHGVPVPEIHQLVEHARPVYNLAMVVAGRPYWLFFTPEGELHDFRYSVDDERYLTVYREQGGYVPVMKNFKFDTEVVPVAAVIESSLFATVTAAGEQDLLALMLADIFMWDIDFYTDIQKGDSFRLLVEKLYLDGNFVKYGKIVAASMSNQGKTLTGYLFHDENGAPAYYGPDGKALKKSFLKSPLKYARISSRFTFARRHPILKIVRPHLGVDYVAPAGTPVRAVGGGIVISAGVSGEGGKTVKLRHTGGYETLYMHLSRITVRSGSRVEQGEVIGYVGATGLATGPHLDFRVIHHHKYVNPTKVIFPPAPPVAESSLAEFASVREGLQVRLDTLDLMAGTGPR